MARQSKQNSPAPLPSDALIDLVNVSRETLDRLEIYARLLERWQSRMNLISPNSLDDIWRRHFLDSAQLHLHLDPAIEGITDLGTGAGFPGLVLGIITGIPVELVESNGRKCAFLREAARETAASVTVHQARIEDVPPWRTGLIVARALAPLDRLLDMAARFSTDFEQDPPICLFLKGKTAASELTQTQKMWNMRAQSIESLSDPSGCILRISGYSRIR